MTLRKALLAATVLALPAAAQAEPISGLYVGAGVGANFRQETTSNGLKLRPETGWAGVGALGWGFGNGLRAEVEGNYRTNQARWRNAAGGTIPGGGYTDTYGVMANVLYDFNLGLPITPYIGGGVGYAWQEIRKARLTFPGASAFIEDTEANFAYQGIAGASYDLGSLGAYGLSATLEYRFLGTMNNTFGVSRTGPGAAAVPVGFRPDNFNHSVLVGLRYAFNAVPPAPPPVVAPVTAPAVARTYLVFFDWDRADLTERARQIIAEAADASRKTQTTRIEVAGHADRSGTPQYNQRLSQRRADAVAAELVRRGVNRGEIAVTAYGESRPLVPTADGVREPQNRRVEIVLK
ncbi:OmpA family protein [Roseicella aquatilis]|uniref:OmpA family protein n=1 Tax=Roseicella aquatilis TaxID=2527868 RepID=A0A4R4DGE4_9PROT|nr:OmpA family protein [Roseicella aquatilis]TCZ59911.1 OmpA family protein [Roseicella aquatilis]